MFETPKSWAYAMLLRSCGCPSNFLCGDLIMRGFLPIVSIVVPFVGLTNPISRILKRQPQKGTTMETIGKLGPAGSTTIRRRPPGHKLHKLQVGASRRRIGFWAPKIVQV